MHLAPSFLNKARSTLRRLGLGRLVLTTRHVLGLGIGRTLQTRLAKRRYLKDILQATSAQPEASRLEVHMLLHHERLHEGMWALHSLFDQVGCSSPVVIHDDGSLTPEDRSAFLRLFPFATIIDRASADAATERFLDEAGLTRCKQLRDTLPFALKLFDVILTSKHRRAVLLDSDVLFFHRPQEILAALAGTDESCLYMSDLDDRYCLTTDTISELVGKACVPRFNPGIAIVPTCINDLQKIEQYLQRPEFWNADGTGGYYAELTLWAMLMSLAEAKPLSPAYAIAPSVDARSTTVCGHYCGGPQARHLFYTDGIPAVRSMLVQGQLHA